MTSSTPTAVRASCEANYTHCLILQGPGHRARREDKTPSKKRDKRQASGGRQADSHTDKSARERFERDRCLPSLISSHLPHPSIYIHTSILVHTSVLYTCRSRPSHCSHAPTCTASTTEHRVAQSRVESSRVKSPTATDPSLTAWTTGPCCRPVK